MVAKEKNQKPNRTKTDEFQAKMSTDQIYLFQTKWNGTVKYLPSIHIRRNQPLGWRSTSEGLMP